MQDISKFFAIFTIVVLAFMVGLNNLYWYYEKDMRESVQVIKEPPTEKAHYETDAEKAFGT